jgi:hypothetical protein
VGVLGRSGAAKNANMFPALLAKDPPANVNMLPTEVGWLGPESRLERELHGA